MTPTAVVRRLERLRLHLEALAPGRPHRLSLATIDEARELIDEVFLLIEQRGDPYVWAPDVGFGDPQAVEVYEDHLERLRRALERALLARGAATFADRDLAWLVTTLEEARVLALWVAESRRAAPGR